MDTIKLSDNDLIAWPSPALAGSAVVVQEENGETHIGLIRRDGNPVWHCGVGDDVHTPVRAVYLLAQPHEVEIT